MSKFKIGDTVVTNISFKVCDISLEKGMKGKVLNIEEDSGLVFIEIYIGDLGFFIVSEDYFDLYKEKKLSDLKDLKIEEDKEIAESDRVEHPNSNGVEACDIMDMVTPPVGLSGSQIHSFYNLIKMIRRFSLKYNVEEEAKKISEEFNHIVNGTYR